MARPLVLALIISLGGLLLVMLDPDLRFWGFLGGLLVVMPPIVILLRLYLAANDYVQGWFRRQ